MDSLIGVMSYDELVVAVEREAAAIADALGSGPSDAAVATCPGWDIHTLATHLGEFTALWTHVVCEATSREKTDYQPTPPREPESLADWYRGLSDHLVIGLRGTTGDQPAWTWVPSRQHVGFIARRCANELGVHRFDAQSARGACAPIEAALAAECVLEIPDLLEGWAQRGDYRHEGSGRRLHLCPTDSAHELTLTLSPGRLEMDRGHTENADLVLRGTTSDLTLVVFDRRPLRPTERAGDPSVLAAWYEEFHFG